MRTGAIFARGSCRALKWMALLGVLFALGAGEAAAQTLTVGTSGTVPEGANRVPVTVRLQVPAETDAGATRAETVTVVLTLTPRPDDVEDRGKEAEFTADAATSDASWADGETGQTVAAGDGTVSITFNNVGNALYDRTERAYLNIGTDSDAEDEEFVITSTSSSSPGTDTITPSGKDVKVKIDDAQTQTYTLAPTNFGTDNTIKESGSIELTLTADPARTVDVDFRVSLDSAEDDSDYGLNSANSTSEDITVRGNVDDAGQPVTGAGSMVITLFSEENDEDRVDDTVTLMTAYAEGDKRGDQAADDVEITVLDQHKLPEIAREDDIEVEDDEGKKSDVTMLYEGQTGTVTLMLDRTGDGVPDSEDIEIELSLGMASTATAQDYRLDPDEVTIAGSGKSGTFEIEALMDEDVAVDGEIVVLMAMVSGDEDNGPNPDGPVMLDAIVIHDTTAKKIEPRTMEEVYAARMAAYEEAGGANGMWNPGEELTLTAKDLFKWPETTMDSNVVLGSVVVDDEGILTASTSNDTLTVMAMSGGTTPISVTATVVGDSAGFIPTQTRSNVATVKFELMVMAHAITAMSDTDVQAAADAAIADAAAESPRNAWEPGGAMAMVALDKLFDVPMEIDASFLAESSDSDDVMAEIYGDSVALTPMSAGMAEITVTAVDTAEGEAATVMFTAMVMAIDPAGITYTLMGPEDMNVAEGMSAMLTVTASDPVPMETEVMIMRDRAASSAADDDYMAEPITIMAGATSGTTRVMAVEDSMAEDMEELVLFAMVGDVMVEGEVKLYLWDAAVPALPIIAQLLLAGILGIGGYRRYRQR